MTKMKLLLTSAAGAAAMAFAASPAAAQYYPSSPVYPTQYGYPNSGQNVIGQIIGQVLGYGQYPYGNYGYGQSQYNRAQVAVDQCARLAEARLNNTAYNYGYNQYNPYGYNNPYRNYAVQGQGRVLGITDVDVRSKGRLRVKGVATSGRNYASPYGYGNYGYNRSYGVPDLSFSCKADYNGRVYDIDFDRRRR